MTRKIRCRLRTTWEPSRLTDVDRGASYKGSPEQSVERRFFVAGTSVILKGFSTVQHSGQVVKILPQCAAATQDRIPVALIAGKKLSVKPTALKVGNGARPDDSMPPPPHATDAALSDEPWTLWDNVGIKPVGAKVDDDAVPEKTMPPLEDDGNKTPAIPKQENPGAGGPTSTYNTLLAVGDGSEALEDVFVGDPYAERRDTRLCRGHQSDPQRSDRIAVQRSGWQDFEKLHDSTTRDRLPVALMREGTRSG